MNIVATVLKGSKNYHSGLPYFRIYARLADGSTAHISTLYRRNKYNEDKVSGYQTAVVPPDGDTFKVSDGHPSKNGITPAKGWTKV